MQFIYLGRGWRNNMKKEQLIKDLSALPDGVEILFKYYDQPAVKDFLLLYYPDISDSEVIDIMQAVESADLDYSFDSIYDVANDYFNDLLKKEYGDDEYNVDDFKKSCEMHPAGLQQCTASQEDDEAVATLKLCKNFTYEDDSSEEDALVCCAHCIISGFKGHCELIKNKE